MILSGESKTELHSNIRHVDANIQDMKRKMLNVVAFDYSVATWRTMIVDFLKDWCNSE